MKKKSIFNKNEVDIDLLFNQPKHLKKMFGKKKDEDDENEVEDTEDDEDEEATRKSVSPQMKKYIEDYIDSKKVKKKERQKGIIEGSLDKLDEKPIFVFDPDNYHDKVKKGEIKPVIQKYLDKFNKQKK